MVAACRSRKREQPRRVLLAGFAQPPAGRLVDQVLVVAKQNLGDLEGVVHLAAAG